MRGISANPASEVEGLLVRSSQALSAQPLRHELTSASRLRSRRTEWPGLAANPVSLLGDFPSDRGSLHVTIPRVRLAPFWLCLASLTSQAGAVLVDRIAAVVDTHAITRSALEERARMLLALAKTDAQKAQARRDALTELIDDRLIQQDAQRLGLRVSDEEVEAALATVATQNQLTVPQLLVETKRQGLDGDAYRGLLRRKILEIKWLNLRANRAAQPPAEADRGVFLASERVRLIEELKSAAAIEVRR